jgi:hypothetical protein
MLDRRQVSASYISCVGVRLVQCCEHLHFHDTHSAGLDPRYVASGRIQQKTPPLTVALLLWAVA